MILYFSGTGNSLWAAQQVAQATNDTCVAVAELWDKTLKTEDGKYLLSCLQTEILGFIFPVYSWGPPPLLLKLISRMVLDACRPQYCYFLATCGDDMGRTKDILEKALQKQHIPLHAGFTLNMPNTYVALPGFDIDSPEIQKQKLETAQTELQNYIQAIRNRQHIYKLIPGKFPWIKSFLIRPFFLRFMIQDRKFVCLDTCISCQKCVRICPVSNIRWHHGKPHWSGQCTGCLACYHICPEHAIHYGNATRSKGQYIHPTKQLKQK